MCLNKQGVCVCVRERARDEGVGEMRMLCESRSILQFSYHFLPKSTTSTHKDRASLDSRACIHMPEVQGKF